MLMRWVVLLLLLANGLYWAGSQGHFSALGWHGPEVGEPERLQAQVRPEVLRLLSVPATPSAAAPAPARAQTDATAPPQADAASCWQAAGWNPRQLNALRTALAGLNLPAGSWQLDEVRNSQPWIIYMGRYNSEAQLERKKTELQALNVAFADVNLPGMSPGLVLGSHATEAEAQAALQALAGVGIRTARVVQDRSGNSSFSLRLPRATLPQRDAVGQAVAPVATAVWLACP